MGISVISSYRGGLNFEAVGPQPRDGGGVFPRHAQPDLRHRHHRRAAAGRGRCTRSAGAAATRCCRSAASTRRGARARATPGRRGRCISCSRPATAGRTTSGSSIPRRCRRGRRSTCATCSTSSRRRRRCRSTRSRSITAIRKRFVTPGMSLGALGPEAHKTLNVAMNRIGAKSDSRRGRRGPGALHAGAERRQPERQDQAGGERAVRGDGGLPQPLRGAGDQDRPGREARRGRAAARDQGDRADRASCGIRRRG